MSRPAPALALALSMLISYATPAVQAADKFGPDVPGARDHPMIKRFAGSWLVGFHSGDWEQVSLPIGMAVDDKKMKEVVTLEGKVTRIVYLAPQGKSRLEVYRNYEQALTAAGMKRRFSCEKGCTDLYFAWSKDLDVVNGFKWAKGYIPQAGSTGSYSPYSALAPDDGRFLYGTVPRGGTDVHVMLYNSVAANNTTDITATTLVIVEPKAMPTGQVTVDAKALQSGLQADGKIALYGIYFDTGKAELKPESKPQFEQMAKLLQAQPALKVYIVGHTDNQGALDANMSLSQQRAQAVAAALSSAYKVDAKRLVAKGVASLAPVGSNAADDSRARNRRVELVVQ
jgi:OmpA-OmpF porin, OOP family